MFHRLEVVVEIETSTKDSKFCMKSHPESALHLFMQRAYTARLWDNLQGLPPICISDDFAAWLSKLVEEKYEVLIRNCVALCCNTVDKIFGFLGIWIDDLKTMVLSLNINNFNFPFPPTLLHSFHIPESYLSQLVFLRDTDMKLRTPQPGQARSIFSHRIYHGVINPSLRRRINEIPKFTPRALRTALHIRPPEVWERQHRSHEF
nr:hypothetical protein AXF42_Ash017075 [Ipomoea batatas]